MQHLCVDAPREQMSLPFHGDVAIHNVVPEKNVSGVLIAHMFLVMRTTAYIECDT